VLMFDQSMEQKLKGTLNGQEKWSGGIVSKRDKLVFEVEGTLENKTF